MKTLENQTLLFDEDCPLCRVYTSGFVKTGMLDANGKKPFAHLTRDEQQFIDVKRAANEIALINNQNKTVLYGIDSLLKVIGNSFPLIETIGNLPPVRFALKKLYSFISYNRKVIIPNAPTPTSKLACVPDFNLKYRFIFMILAGLVTSFVLWKFSAHMPIPEGTIYRELLLAFGQIAFQALFMLTIERQKTINYFGNLMTVSLMGAILLTIMLVIEKFVHFPPILFEGWFALTVLIMFAEHFRRIKLLELPHHLCYTWVLYRIIALLLILNL